MECEVKQGVPLHHNAVLLNNNGMQSKTVQLNYSSEDFTSNVALLGTN
jgi:hypothetical protein